MRSCLVLSESICSHFRSLKHPCRTLTFFVMLQNGMFCNLDVASPAQYRPDILHQQTCRIPAEDLLLRLTLKDIRTLLMITICFLHPDFHMSQYCDYILFCKNTYIRSALLTSSSVYNTLLLTRYNAVQQISRAHFQWNVYTPLQLDFGLRLSFRV